MDQSACRTGSHDLSIKSSCQIHVKWRHRGDDVIGVMTCCKRVSRYSVAPVTLTLTLEPCYPNPNPKGSYMSRRPWSLIHVGTLRENSRGRMRTRDTWVLGGFTAFPWVLTLTLGWGWVEGPPGQSLNPRVVTWVFPREFKKRKKNKHIFLAQCSNSGLLHLNPNVLQAGTCARP